MDVQTCTHPSADRLIDFSLGRLAYSVRESIERHLESCEECCNFLVSRGENRDTLLELARDASSSASDRTPCQNSSIPPELSEHPRYRILGLLGEGGMGVVYKAEHKMMNRTVALKVISKRLTANDQAVERFCREVRAAALLSHSNIVTAFDAEEANGLHFLVMEFVDGISLDRYVAKQRNPIPVQLACHFIRQAALGLQHAHQLGMVHRDIKPQNLILTRKGKVKILDFGLARLREDQSDAGPATQNIVVGTPDFLSPEQARDSHTVDIRADIYALGCTLYFLLTRRVPFPCNSSFEKMLAHASTMPEPVDSFRSDVPQELKAILATMIAKRAEDRFQTPQEVVAALAPFAKLTTAGSSAIDTPMTSPRPPEVAPLDENPDADAATAVLVFKPQQQRRRTKNGRANKPSWLPIGLAVGALVAACLLVFFLLRDPSDPHKSKAAESKTEVAKSRPQDQVAKQFNSTPTQPKLKEKLPATQPEEVNPPEVKFQPPEGKFPPDGKFPKFDGKKGFPPPLREVRWEDAKYHVLIAVAKNGAWFDDYAPLRGNLQQQGIHVSVVSSEWGTITPQYNRGPRGMELEAKFAFTSEFDFREYDAIIVIGGQVDTFNPQFTAKKDWMKEGKQDPAKMIGVKLQKMLDANKLVAAIGSGQAVLVWHNILKDGMKAARVGHDEEYELGMKYPKIKWNDSQGVVRDGNVITAGGAPDADRLAEEIVRALEGTKK